MEKKSNHTSLFKEAMGNYPTGVSVVTAMDESGEPIGLTVNSLASVSIDPLLILWSIDENVSTYDTFRKIDHFAVNILSGDQKDLAILFSTDHDNRFAACDWELSEHGLPILSNSLAIFECKTYKQIEIGDHTTLFGEVINIEVEDELPLLYHDRKMGAFPMDFHKE